MNNKILIVDDKKSVLTALEMLIQTEFDEVITLNNPNSLIATIEKNSVDIVLLDMNFRSGINNGNEGIFWLNEILKFDSSIIVIMITAFGDVELAVRTVKEGAGMTEKGVKEYRKKNPGSKLQTAVTEKNPKGKRAARRKSFCARSKGWTSERGKAARRRWNC